MSKIAERVCGNCTACCKTHHISEFDKPAGKWCAHCEVGKGCLIYSERPKNCRVFVCQWLKGFGAEKMRPDKSKIVIDCPFVKGLGETILAIFEVTEGAIEQKFVKELLQKALNAGFIVYFMRLRAGKQIFLPPEISLSVALIKRLKEEEVEIYAAK